MAGRFFGEMDDRIAMSPRKSASRITGFEMRPDGLMVPTYRRRKRSRSFSVARLLRGLVLAFVAVMAFKAIIYAQAGAGGYEERLGRFGTEDTAAQVVTFVMQVDPVTEFMGGALRELMRGDVAPALESLALD